MRAGEKAMLYREFAKLIGAGYHLDRAIGLLLGQNPPRHRKAFLQGMQQGLAEGKGFAESIASQSTDLAGGLEKSLIAAGEQSGKLAESFSHLARYFGAVEGAMRQSRGAIIYPLVLLHLAIVLPEIPAMIAPQEGDDSSPWVRLLLMIGGLWVLLFVVGWIWRWLTRRAVESVAFDRIVTLVPFIGKARRHWALARFTQVFHSGLLAALRMSDILELAGEASQSGRIHAAAKDAAEKVAAGDTLSLALAATGGFPTDFIHTLATAEETGTVDEEMARRAVAETMLASEAINTASVWLPRIGYALVVVFVVYRIFKMMFGVYEPILRQLDQL